MVLAHLSAWDSASFPASTRNELVALIEKYPRACFRVLSPISNIISYKEFVSLVPHEFSFLSRFIGVTFQDKSACYDKTDAFSLLGLNDNTSRAIQLYQCFGLIEVWKNKNTPLTFQAWKSLFQNCQVLWFRPFTGSKTGLEILPSHILSFIQKVPLESLFLSSQF
jgi:hypothetical protein